MHRAGEESRAPQTQMVLLARRRVALWRESTSSWLWPSGWEATLQWVRHYRQKTIVLARSVLTRPRPRRATDQCAGTWSSAGPQSLASLQRRPAPLPSAARGVERTREGGVVMSEQCSCTCHGMRRAQLAISEPCCPRCAAARARKYVASW